MPAAITDIALTLLSLYAATDIFIELNIAAFIFADY